MSRQTATAGISAREAEILALVGEHRSNAEIGAQLFISLAWVWLHWYIALRAEAAVLVGHPGASHHLTAGRPIVAGNPIATAILDRAAALLDGDHERLLTTAAAFETAGCPYQRARTLILAGCDTAPAGNAALADLGLTAVAVTG